MNADDLRAVAADIRQKASAATPGPWLADGAGGVGSFHPGLPRGQRGITDDTWSWDAQHIAAWHPTVALAVAAMLDRDADAWDVYEQPDIDPSLAFVKAWRGESS